MCALVKESTTAHPEFRLSREDETTTWGTEIDKARVFHASILLPDMTAVPTYTRWHVTNITAALYGRCIGESKPLERNNSVADELQRIRQLTTLSMTDVARLCGVRRRHLYNLLDGESTETHRAARIRAIAEALEQRAKHFPEPTMFRSALLAPLDYQGRDFISIASSNDPSAVAVACRLFDAYTVRLDGARPMTRLMGHPPTESQEAIGYLRRLHGET